MIVKDDEQEGNGFVVIQNLTKCKSKNEYFLAGIISNNYFVRN